MRYRFQSNDRIYEINIERTAGRDRGQQPDSYQATIDGQPYTFEILDSQPGQLTLRFNDRPITLYWAADGAQKWVSQSGCTYRLDRPAPKTARAASSDTPGGESVRAPMPAQVRAVQVQEGDSVEKGQTLLLLEAMKMEIRIKAPTAGTVTKRHVTPGQTVEKDQVLVDISSNL